MDLRLKYSILALLLLNSSPLRAGIEELLLPDSPLFEPFLRYLMPIPLDVVADHMADDDPLPELVDVPPRTDQSPLGTAPSELDKQFEILDEDIRQAADISSQAYAQLNEQLNRKVSDHEFAAYVVEKYINQLGFCVGKAINVYHVIHNAKQPDSSSLIYENVDFLRKSLTKSSEEVWFENVSKREKPPESLDQNFSDEELDSSATIEDPNFQGLDLQFDLEID